MTRDQTTDDDLRVLDALHNACPNGWHPVGYQPPRRDDVVLYDRDKKHCSIDKPTCWIILAPDEPQAQSCPVCGHAPEVSLMYRIGDQEQWQVHCRTPDCYLSAPNAKSKIGAIDRWNRLRFAEETK